MIEEIRAGERRSRCHDAMEARFSEAVGRTVESASLGDDPAVLLGAADAKAIGDLLFQVARGADPCELVLTIPDPTERTPPR